MESECNDRLSILLSGSESIEQPEDDEEASERERYISHYFSRHHHGLIHESDWMKVSALSRREKERYYF
jgi:hypothetical protein